MVEILLGAPGSWGLILQASVVRGPACIGVPSGLVAPALPALAVFAPYREMRVWFGVRSL